jgi:hypothetical protein
MIKGAVRRWVWRPAMLSEEDSRIRYMTIDVQHLLDSAPRDSGRLAKGGG